MFTLLPDWQIRKLSQTKTPIFEKETVKEGVVTFERIYPKDNWFVESATKQDITNMYEQELGVRTLISPEAKVWATMIAQTPMIEGFKPESIKTLNLNGTDFKIPSAGLSSYGYDITLGRGFKIAKVGAALDGSGKVKAWNIVKDLDAINTNCFETSPDLNTLVLPPYGFAIGVSVEKINMPRNVTGICMAKSTLARLGIDAKVSPWVAGWSGYNTLEISNCTPNYYEIPAGVGIMQLLFVQSYACETSYADRKGKYMDQSSEPVLARL
jgi:dCTP deaminase